MAQQTAFLERFRLAFDHRDSSERTVQSLLDQRELDFVQEYRALNNLAPPSGKISGSEQASDAEIACVTSLRQRLASEHHELNGTVCDSDLLRFTRARNADVDGAFKLLLDCVACHAELGIAELRCSVCAHNKKCADLRVVGFDTQHRPVIYSSFRGSALRSPEATQLHTACIMSKAAKCLSDGCPQNIIWVNNFNGFSLWDLNPMFAIKAANVFSTAFPERLKLKIIVDPPAIFWGLLKVVKPVIAAETYAKVMFVETNEAGRLRLEEVLGTELGNHVYQQACADR